MELGTEKSATQKLESGKLVLERQNKELKAKLAELETAGRAKTKVSGTYPWEMSISIGKLKKTFLRRRGLLLLPIGKLKD